MQFAGNPLHRRLGRHPAADHVADAAQPAGIGRHQPVSLQHLPRCIHVRRPTVRRHFGKQIVQPTLHPVHRLVQPHLLRLRIIGQQPHDRPPGPQQHNRANRDPAHQRGCGEQPRHCRAKPFGGAVRRTAARQHLGQQHRNRLEVIDLGIGEIARRPVLHHQNAHGPSGTPHRHRQHRRERLLSGFRPVRERRVVLGVRQVHHVSGSSA